MTLLIIKLLASGIIVRIVQILGEMLLDWMKELKIKYILTKLCQLMYCSLALQILVVIAKGGW